MKLAVKSGDRSIANLVTGVLSQVLSVIMGLVLPYLFITNFGSETNGLLSTIGQLFVYLNLLEAGVGAVSRQALYKPITNNDKKEINRILSATHQYYIRTGVVYAFLVVVAAMIFPFLITGSLTKATIFKVVLLEGVGSVWSYFFQAKYAIFLRAEGKVYVLNNANLVASIFRNFGKIIAISLGYDVVAVMLVQCIVSMLQSSIIITYVRKRYPWISFKEQPDFKAINQKNSVLLQSLTWVVFNHTDVMLLTIIAKNLALVSVYSVYMLVFESVQNFLEAILSSFYHKLGWKGQKSERELRVFYLRYEVFFLAIANALFFIAYVMISPFLQLYVGSVQDIDYMIKGLPVLFLIMKILYSYRSFNKQLADAVGHFRKTQYINITEMILNLTTSLVLVYKYNIKGVLLGTIISLVFSDIMYIYHNSKFILKIDCFHTVISFFIYVGLGFLLAKVIAFYIPNIESYYEWVLAAIPVALLIFGAFLLCSLLLKRVVERIYKL